MQVNVPELPIDSATVDRLLGLVAKEGMVERDKLTLDATLDSLGIKSVDVVTILMAMEEEFGVYIPIDEDLSEAETVSDILNVLAAHLPSEPS